MPFVGQTTEHEHPQEMIVLTSPLFRAREAQESHAKAKARDLRWPFIVVIEKTLQSVWCLHAYLPDIAVVSLH